MFLFSMISPSKIPIPEIFTSAWSSIASQHVLDPLRALDLFNDAFAHLKEFLRFEKAPFHKLHKSDLHILSELVAQLGPNFPPTLTVADISRLRDRSTGRLLVFSRFHDETESIDERGYSEALKKAFEEIPFNDVMVGGQSISKYLMTTLSNYALQWGSFPSEYHSPYAVVVNASMTGKSRSIAELRNHGVFVITISLNCLPPGTNLFADWAENCQSRVHCTSQTCVLFITCLQQLRDWLQRKLDERGNAAGYELRDLTLEWFEYSKAFSVWNSIVHKILKSELPRETAPKTSADMQQNIVEQWSGFYFKSMPENGCVRKPLHIEIRDLLEELVMKDSTVPLREDALNILFCIDQLSVLKGITTNECDRVAAFRHAFKVLPENAGIPNTFFVLTDTSPSLLLEKPEPSYQYQPSRRVAETGKLLYNPINLIVPPDSWWRRVQSIDISDALDEEETLKVIEDSLLGKELSGVRAIGSLRENLTLALIERLEFLSLMGRPAYFGLLAKMPGGAFLKARAFLEFLKRKLGVINDSRKTPLTALQAIAILGAIASFEINPSSIESLDLVAGHMRYLAAISNYRDRLFTLEFSEPPLALASHQLLISEKVQWEEVLEGVASAFSRATISQGRRFDLAVQILLLHVWQKFLGPTLGGVVVASIPATQFLDVLFKSQLDRLNQHVALAALLLRRDQLQVIADAVAAFEKHGVGRERIWCWLSGLIDSQRSAGPCFSQTYKIPTIRNDADIFMTHAKRVGVCLMALGQAIKLMSEAYETTSFCHVKAGVDALTSLLYYEEIRNEFAGAFVRVNQFVRCFGGPSKRSLLEYFIRSSAIYSANGLGSGELIIPVYFPPKGVQFVREEFFSSIVFQMRPSQDRVSESDKMSWTQELLQLSSEFRDKKMPFLAVFCDLGDKRSCALDIKRIFGIGIGNLSTERFAENQRAGYAFYSRGLRPSMIDKNFDLRDSYFEDLFIPGRDSTPRSWELLGLTKGSEYF